MTSSQWSVMTEQPKILICTDSLSPLLSLQDSLSIKRHQSEKPRIIVLCQQNSNVFDPTILNQFPDLYRLSLINSNITEFSHSFPAHKHLQVLNFTRLNLAHVQVSAFLKLKALRVIDFSYNRLKVLDKVGFEFVPHLQQIYLKGDNWECNNKMKWIIDKKNTSVGRKVMDADQMVCGSTTYPGKPLVQLMKLLKNLEQECHNMEMGRCRCVLDNVVWSTSLQYLVPLITVNCSGVGLQHLPRYVPTNATRLILNNNNISDLRFLAINPTYQEIFDIYFDNNSIHNIDVLEGSDWLTKFRVFSLRSNKLSSFPTFVLENGFRKNSQIIKIYFGNNPWSCDCSFTPSFKELLVKYYDVIVDVDDVKCAFDENDDNSMKKINELKLSSICRVSSEFLTMIDCLNIVLASLIVFVLSKLVYDYWIYKSTGKLPWIITKIP